ncbi:hypothetical protein ACXR0O_08720 [Verrucomicrobiota bacterium sgz303538]
MNARAITLDELHALGYAPTGEDSFISEDEGRSSLLEVADLDDGRIADFSVLYCFTARYGMIIPMPFAYFSEVARKVIQELRGD